MVSKSWRSQTQRTPAGETTSPCDAHLAERRLLGRESDDRVFDLLGHAVLQHGLLAADLCQRQLAAFLLKFLKAVEAVARIPEHLASLADVAKLLGKLE
jgi:hypothetical protein